MSQDKDFRERTHKMRAAIEAIDPGSNFPEGYFEPPDHLTHLKNSIENLHNDPLYQRWVEGITSKLERTEDYKDHIYEQENLQFLMDHHLFYWKMDRFMLPAWEIPSRDKIAMDRYLAHGARQNLLELWKKKSGREA